jgi:hypothetical protein
MRPSRFGSLVALLVSLTAAGAHARQPPPDSAPLTGALETPQPLDRYGGGLPPPADAAPLAGPRYLAWSGKTDPSLSSPSSPSRASAGDPGGAAATSAPSAPPAPSGGEAGATARVQPRQTAGGPRFYSLHRDYGIEPDAIPLPPQFFGATADLSAPPPSEAPKRVITSNGQTHVVQPTSDDQGGL